MSVPSRLCLLVLRIYLLTFANALSCVWAFIQTISNVQVFVEQTSRAFLFFLRLVTLLAASPECQGYGAMDASPSEIVMWSWSYERGSLYPLSLAWLTVHYWPSFFDQSEKNMLSFRNFYFKKKKFHKPWYKFRSVDSFQLSGFPFYLVNPRDQPQVVRLEEEHLYSLTHLCGLLLSVRFQFYNLIWELDGMGSVCLLPWGAANSATHSQEQPGTLYLTELLAWPWANATALITALGSYLVNSQILTLPSAFWWF